MLQNLKSRKWLFSPVPEPAQKCENNVASFVHKIFLKWPLLVVSAFEGKSRFPLQNVFITLASWLSCRVYEPLFGVTTNLTALDDDGGTFGLIVKTENTKFYFILKTQKILRPSNFASTIFKKTGSSTIFCAAIWRTSDI